MKRRTFLILFLLSPILFPNQILAYRTYREHIALKGQTFWTIALDSVNQAPVYPESSSAARTAAMVAYQNLLIILNNADPSRPKVNEGQTYTILSQQQVDDFTYQVTKYITLNGWKKVFADTVQKDGVAYALANVWGNFNWEGLIMTSKTLSLLEIDETDWIKFKGSSYRKINTGIKTWDESEKMCEALGGKLASITNQAENDFVATLCHVGEMCRLGHRSPSGYCSTNLPNWIDGKPFTYSNWSTGEPGYACSEDCLDMHKGGEWNNEWCNNPYKYDKYSICER